MFEPFTMTDAEAFRLFIVAADLILAAVAVRFIAAIWDN